MIPAIPDLLAAVPQFALVFARVCAALIFLPGLGEAAAPVTVRVGLSVAFSLLLAPILPPVPEAVQDGSPLALTILVKEVVTGLWFGWMVRLSALALSAAGQFVGLLMGLSNVLQQDAELGAQSNVLGALFSLSAPLLFLVTRLYELPLQALAGLFELVPVGALLPAADTAEAAIAAVGASFALAVQVASPFVLMAIAWYFIVGQIARVAHRMQVYFMSLPGQILAGLVLLAATAHLIIGAWQRGAEEQLRGLAGL